MLKLIPPSAPGPKQALIERVKKFPRPPGLLQCPRCGSRTIMTSKNGVMIVDGRKKHGTVIHQDVCADCYRQGDIVPVIPKIERVP